MSAATPAPKARDARADELRRAAFREERLANEWKLLADEHPEKAEVAAIAREHADAAWNHLWLYLDGLAS